MEIASSSPGTLNAHAASRLPPMPVCPMQLPRPGTTRRPRTQQLLVLLMMIEGIGTAQTPRTSVIDTVYDGSGNPVTGSCTYQAIADFQGLSGSQIVGEPVTVTILNGAFSASLVPTDTGVPSIYYVVKCSGRRGWARRGNWLVPTSGTPLKLKDLWVASPPPPNLFILLSQIPPAGAGSFCLVSVNGVLSWQACTGGSGGVLHWTTLTNPQWIALAN